MKLLMIWFFYGKEENVIKEDYTQDIDETDMNLIKWYNYSRSCSSVIINYATILKNLNQILIKFLSIYD
jgi:hypothetical protein